MNDATKATLVSIIPKEVNFDIPHISPSRYTIPASVNGVPQLLVIGEGSYDLYIGEGRNLRQFEPAYKLAASMVEDFINAQLFSSGETVRPGLFYIPGTPTLEEIKKNHAAQLAEAYQLQRGWFTALIRDADDFWSKFHQHKGISDLQRMACKEMGLERDWLFVVPDNAPLKCPACRSVLDPLALICLNCKTVVKPEEYKKLQLASA